MQKKSLWNRSYDAQPKIASTGPFFGTSTLFSLTPLVAFISELITQVPLLIKSQHIIICCKRIFKTTHEVQILLKNLQDVPQVANKVPNGILPDLMCTLYWGTLNLQNVILFHCPHVNVIEFMPIRKYSLPFTIFCEAHGCLTAFCANLLILKFTRISINVESLDRNSFMLVSKE